MAVVTIRNIQIIGTVSTVTVAPNVLGLRNVCFYIFQCEFRMKKVARNVSGNCVHIAL
jgi:hypothetical protein